jgi:hypothetical protein
LLVALWFRRWYERLLQRDTTSEPGHYQIAKAAVSGGNGNAPASQ